MHEIWLWKCQSTVQSKPLIYSQHWHRHHVWFVMTTVLWFLISSWRQLNTTAQHSLEIESWKTLEYSPHLILFCYFWNAYAFECDQKGHILFESFSSSGNLIELVRITFVSKMTFQSKLLMIFSTKFSIGFFLWFIKFNAETKSDMRRVLTFSSCGL